MFSRDQARPRLPFLVALVAVLAAGAAACATEPPARPSPSDQPVPRVAVAAVLAAVRKAPAIRKVPADLTPSLATAGDDMGFDNEKCEAAPLADRIAEPCVFGDKASAVRVVLFGDSHAGMWLPALAPIALSRHWRLEFYGKPACPTPRLAFWNEQEGRPFPECDRFRDFVLNRIEAQRPDLVVVTNGSFGRKLGRGVPVTPQQWRAGLGETLTGIRRAASRVIVLGDIPVPDESPPECLAAHAANVRACFTGRAKAVERVWNAADEAAAKDAGATYIPVLPLVCSAMCTPVIGNIVVYRNRFHLTATYARMLTGVLEGALLEAVPPDPVP